MKTAKEIKQMIRAIRSDPRMKRKPAIVDINGPLALIQCNLEGKLDALNWVLAKRKCRVCGCTDADCRQCIEKTGAPCHWVEADLCSACVTARTRRLPANRRPGRR